MGRLRGEGVDTEIVNFDDHRIEPCQHCAYECLHKRLCLIEDDVAWIGAQGLGNGHPLPFYFKSRQLPARLVDGLQPEDPGAVFPGSQAGLCQRSRYRDAPFFHWRPMDPFDDGGLTGVAAHEGGLLRIDQQQRLRPWLLSAASSTRRTCAGGWILWRSGPWSWRSSRADIGRIHEILRSKYQNGILCEFG